MVENTYQKIIPNMNRLLLCTLIPVFLFSCNMYEELREPEKTEGSRELS